MSCDVLRCLAAVEHWLEVIFNARDFGHIRSAYYAMLQARVDRYLVPTAPVHA